jgi:hypothetical protein
MSSGSEKRTLICEGFTKDILSLFGRPAVSIILYGSGVSEEYNPKKSDLNFLVVLEETTINEIDRVQPFVSRWRQRGISLPLFVTEDYIRRSLDTFPVEFYNMKTQYELLHGEDVLRDLKFKSSEMRLQCERELKSHLIQLRQQYLNTGGRIRAVRRLVSDSISSLIAIFKALLFLKEIDLPSRKQEVVLAACRAFSLDEGLFSVLLSIRGYATSLSGADTVDIMKRYIDSVDKLSRSVDAMS